MSKTSMLETVAKRRQDKIFSQKCWTRESGFILALLCFLIKIYVFCFLWRILHFFPFFLGGGGIAKCLPKTSCANMVPHNMSEKTFNFIKIICFRLCLYQMRRPCCWSLEYVTFLPWAQSAQTQSCTDSSMKISRRWIWQLMKHCNLYFLMF